jgi:hypothetical protein
MNIKKGDIVFCKTNVFKYVTWNLTIHNSYKIIDFDINYILIQNDSGYLSNYDKKMFITSAEWREKQIKSVIDGDT